MTTMTTMTTTTTFLLVPGAGGNATAWYRVVPLLEAAGHRAVAVDLPAGDDDAGLDAYTDAIVRAGAAAAQDGIVLVASSLAGFSAPQTCGTLAVRRLVLVNAMIPRPGETPGEWWADTGQPQAQQERARHEGRTVSDPFDIRQEFFHDVPADVKAEVFSQPEPRQSGRPFSDPWPLSAWPEVPTRVISSRDDRFFPLAFQQRVARERLHLEPEVVPGGHLAALSQPEALTEALLRPR
jgi:pimeloyl-ACP methyl ester carboxylesterase